MGYKDTVEIHTVIKKDEKKKLLSYGKGKLNLGIKNILNLIEDKELKIIIQTNVYII